MKPSSFPLGFFNFLPSSAVYSEGYQRPVTVKMSLTVNLLEDEALLQKHQSKTITVYKRQKT